MKGCLSVSPYRRKKRTTFLRRMEFFVCVALLWASAILHYCVAVSPENGLSCFLHGCVGISFARIPDFFFYLTVFSEKDNPHRLEFYFNKVLRSYSYVSGLILALLCPLSLPYWQLMIGSAFSVLVFKLLFGGFGKNIVNPAVFGRVFLQLRFSSSWSSSQTDLEGSLLESGAFGSNLRGMGEPFYIALLLIGVYLCIRGIMDFRTPVFYLLSLYLSFLFRFIGAGKGWESFYYAFRYLVSGSLVFVGVLCLSDPVTSPTSHSGRIRFTLSAALLTELIILYASHAGDGAPYALLSVNVRTPFFDRINRGKTDRILRPSIVCSCLFVAVIVTGLLFGLICPGQTRM